MCGWFFPFTRGRDHRPIVSISPLSGGKKTSCFCLAATLKATKSKTEGVTGSMEEITYGYISNSCFLLYFFFVRVVVLKTSSNDFRMSFHLLF